MLNQNENNPLITVVTVVYNGKDFIEKTILSVICQSYKNIEYIVIDGGSTDGTVDIIKNYEDKIAYWISEKDTGLYDAMNKGCLRSRGAGITFLNAGDVYLGDVFNDVLEFPAIIRCKVKYSNGVFFEKKIGNPKMGMPISHQSIIYKNNHYLYALDYKISSDYDFSLNQRVFENPQYLNGGFVVYDNFGLSSSKYWRRDLEAAKIINKNFGKSRVVVFMIVQIVKNLVKECMFWR
jgi:glycosyltransferase involved in cell wall biosynthesis